jgi:putative transposase
MSGGLRTGSLQMKAPIFVNIPKMGAFMLPQRKTLRLKGYDYSQPGMYFVTIDVQDRHECLSEIINDCAVLNPYGQIVAEQWQTLSQYVTCQPRDLIVMPDHVHGILEIDDVGTAVHSRPDGVEDSDCSRDSEACGQASLHSLSFYVRAFKLFSARRINALKPERPFAWHRSFHDRIIRNEKELDSIREYMANNSKDWAMQKITNSGR